MSRYFEDLSEGLTLDLGTVTFTQEAIKTFAARYDPQRFHLDEAEAAKTIFGTLSASGWHTAGEFVRCFEETWGRGGDGASTLGSWRGFRRLRWVLPVRAGDTLAFAATVTALAAADHQDGANPGKVDTGFPSGFATRKKDGATQWGQVTWHATGTNQDGELAYAFDGDILVRRR